MRVNLKRRHLVKVVPLLLLVLAGCSQSFDPDLHHVAMPGGDDANHPAAPGAPSVAENTGADHSLQGMWTHYMTFPDSSGN